MEVKLVGWTTGSRKFPDADVFVDVAERGRLTYLADKAVKEDIIKNKWKFSGEWHQNGKCGMPVISVDGCIGQYMLSWRGWGSLMAEAWNDIEQEFKYDYMDFYMNCWLDGKCGAVHSEEEYVHGS